MVFKCKIPKKKIKTRIRLSVRFETESGNKSTRFGIAHIDIDNTNQSRIEVPLEKCDYCSILCASVRYRDNAQDTVAQYEDENASPSTESPETPLSDELLDTEEMLGIHIDEDRFASLEAQVDDMLLKIIKE